MVSHARRQNTSAHNKAVTPSDGANIPGALTCVGLRITGTAGNLHYLDGFGNELTEAVPLGLFQSPVKKVFATGTTATGIFSLHDRA
jgi:hypothetical protein